MEEATQEQPTGRNTADIFPLLLLAPIVRLLLFMNAFTEV